MRIRFEMLYKVPCFYQKIISDNPEIQYTQTTSTKEHGRKRKKERDKEEDGESIDLLSDADSALGSIVCCIAKCEALLSANDLEENSKDDKVSSVPMLTFN